MIALIFFSSCSITLVEKGEKRPSIMFVVLLMFVFTFAMLQVVVACQKILFIGYGIN